MIAPRAARGQALAEFLVGATLFLIPVFLIIPLLGKYADMKGAVIQAARYNAWERTVWYGGTASSRGDWASNDKSETAIRSDMAARFFGNSLNGELWKDRAGSPMLANYTNTLVNNASPSTADYLLDFVVTAIGMISPFTLETKGLYAGTAVINTAAITPVGQVIERAGTETWGGLGLMITDKTVVLANGWGAGGGDHAKTQAKGLMPLGFLDSDVFTVLRWLLVVFMPELAPAYLPSFDQEKDPGLVPGRIQVDEVPPDRLKP